mmetsp:Transcript_5425/g.5077  ORF Transcript_5425/g.5077 Transcript_5425/m.5077 type:complete len:153 (-) Transcript_5425:315-773(-)|eukprot:CAMPEP_0197831728 /NCGR_PEP_ID=MMETSP1437-20131217/11753_1 /TAXON_ID=49252 ORGANISM="Eucampia antarctica, Strain CCMP1452" /NCGR_SAMPLE_ID=MMETSP1437 /ASSEMBLY_ACC=CAM_ASM_001096 /LENGTH=152 /DNA_ID=CAMNT_0043434767 /DNA_START=28 /DNA_END=486 /DNA_ORIENTATION=+
MKFVILAVIASTAAAFVAPNAATVASTTALNAEESGRRQFFSKAAGAAAFLAAAGPANAMRDYENIALLGGSSIVDINNANVRAYLKMPGMYPTVAGKVVTNGPYSEVKDLYKIPGLTSREADVLKKYDYKFVTKSPVAEYVIDRFNNGLYR